MEGLVNKILKSSREMNKKEKEIGNKIKNQIDPRDSISA